MAADCRLCTGGFIQVVPVFGVRGIRRVAALAALVVGFGVVQPAWAVAAPEPVAVVDEAPDEARAQALAKQLGRSVRITGKTTETDEFWATPDGGFTWRQHQRPVRVKRDGQWTAVDTTLVKRADGTIAPKTTVVDLALSGGGKGTPLAKMAHGGAEIGLTWASDLPEPVLDGPSATYPEVFPGVDLKVTADVIGFSEVLVVKTPEAARNPQLRKVTFGSHTKNTKVRTAAKKTAADPGLEVVDADGAVRFTGDATRMWDSSGDGEVGRRTAVMVAEVTPESVTIIPDQEFLRHKDTKFPVYLDPDYSCGSCGKAHHVVVQSGYPTARNLDAWQGDLADLKAGYQNSDSSGVSRSYVQMNTGAVKWKNIHWATLNTTLNYSWWGAGSAKPTEVYLSGWIDGNTTWNNQPGAGTFQSSSNVTNQSKAPNVSMQFDVTGAVRSASAGGWDLTTFLLKGEQEGNTYSWRRFGLNPYLETHYNSTPNNPWSHSMQNGTLPCVKGENRPWVATRTPQLQAWVSDPDGGGLEVMIATSGGPYGADVPGTYFDNANSRPYIGTPGANQGALAQVAVPSGWINSDGIYKWAMKVYDGEAWSPRWDWDCEFFVDATPPLAPVTRPTNTPANQGDIATFDISVDMATANLYDIDRFVYTLDGSEPSTQGSPSVPAGRKDENGKITATAQLSTTARNANQNLLKVRAVNKAGTPGPSGSCVAPLTTVGTAPNTACAYVVQPLTSAKYLKGAWALDDQFGTTAADNVATLNPGQTAHPATLGGSAGWNAGHNRGSSWTQADAFGAKDGVKGGLQLADNGYAATAQPVVDTTQSFSVSAWAMLNRTDSYYTVASQDAGTVSGFYLQFSHDVGKWSFSTTNSDAVSDTANRATSADGSAAPALGVWTHLVGTYDAPAKQLSLYVDGKLAGTKVMANPLFPATGPFVIGGAKWSGNRADFFPGKIDDVQAWQRVLSAQDVRDLAGVSTSRVTLGLAEGAAEKLATGATGDEFSGNYVPAPVKSLQGFWKFDEGTGTTAADSSNNGAGYDNNLITTGATWVPGKSGSALHYAGTSDSSSRSAGPAVNTAQSFTVSAWVKPDDLNGYYGVVGQSGTNVPGFAIRYSPDVKAWIFGLNTEDRAGAETQWAWGPGPAKTDWTLVTGVYNNDTKRIQLYLDGRLVASRPFTGTPWNAAGKVTVGTYDFGSPTHFFKGSIDSVQLWQQALTASQVAALAGLSYVDSAWHVDGHWSATATGDVSLVTDSDAAYARFQPTAGTALTVPRAQDFRTDRSYTVEAWVKHDATNTMTKSAVSVDDTTNGPFSLGYRKDDQTEGKWSLVVPCTRDQANCLKYAWSDAAAENGKWTHLAMTYDRATGTACLYVNGQKQSGCITDVPAYDGNGTLTLGNFKWGGNAVDQWHGGIAGVRVHSGVRTVSQIQDDRTADDPGALFGAVH